MCNLEEYKICKADSEEWGRYHAIYRLSNFNEWMPLSFQGEIDRYKKVDFCYWVIKDDKRIGGALIKPNMLKCVFVIPPFSNKRILLEKLSLYVDSISNRNEAIEVHNADLKSIEDYESLGYKLDIINKLMVCATNKFDVDWEQEYKVINPNILDFVVHPKFQRKGLAAKMMKRTLDFAAGNYPAIRLNVTVGNEAEIFYNKLGFVSLAEDVQMKKCLYNS